MSHAPTLLTTRRAPTLLGVVNRQPQMVAPPAQGPAGPAGIASTVPGPQGPQGISGSSSVAVTVASSISGNLIVVRTPAGLAYASANQPVRSGQIIGMSLNSASPGGVVQVARSGEVTEPTWSWVPEQPIYLGLNGNPTQTPPTTSGWYSQIVGFAISATTLFLSFGEPITLA